MVATPKCALCNSRGQRRCPAVDGSICSYCCGTKRIDPLDCPKDCKFNPFGIDSYDDWLKADAGWIRKSMDRLADSLPKEEFGRLVEKYKTAINDDDPEGYLPAVAFEGLFRWKDEGGQTPVERWKAEGLEGLKHDEKLMIQFREEAFYTVIEVQQVLDEQSMICIDLLEENARPFLLFDRSLAARANRFDRLFSQVTPYPHYSRLSGLSLFIAPGMSEDLLSELRDWALDEVGVDTGPEMKIYLEQIIERVCSRLFEMARAPDRRQPSIDANLFTTTYRLQVDREKIERTLREKPDFERTGQGDDDEAALPSSDCYSWLRAGESKKIEQEIPTMLQHTEGSSMVGLLGTIWMSDDRFRMQIMTGPKQKFARRMVQKYFRGKMKLETETKRDLTEEMIGRAEAEEPAPPPEIPQEVQATMVMGMMENHYEAFLDTPVPALGEMTPRQAAGDPEMREDLVRLMKDHLNQVDRMSREQGIPIDIGWVLDELGLESLR